MLKLHLTKDFLVQDDHEKDQANKVDLLEAPQALVPKHFVKAYCAQQARVPLKLLLKKMLTKKLKQGKILLKLLVVLEVVVEQAVVEAALLKEVVGKGDVEEAGWEDLVDKKAVHKLFVTVLLLQAIMA